MFYNRTYREPMLLHGIFKNKLWWIWSGAVIITFIFTVYIPDLQEVFKTVPLNGSHFLEVLVLSLFCTCWIELVKGIVWVYYYRRG